MLLFFKKIFSSHFFLQLIFDDVTNDPLITQALLQKGYSEKDIDKILGGNFLRVLKANEVK